jgi:hypothetical protein
MAADGGTRSPVLVHAANLSIRADSSLGVPYRAR